MKLNLRMAMIIGATSVLALGCGKEDDAAKSNEPAKAAEPAAEKPTAEEAPAEGKPAAEAEAAPAEPVDKKVEAAGDAKPEGEAAKAEGESEKKDEAKADPFAAPKDVASPPKEAKVTESGLAYVILEEGKGDQTPRAEDTVRVHYTGWTTDGRMFDSSRKRGEPAVFPLNGVIAGWTEGVGLMREGEKRRLWIPEDLAYKGRPGRPAGMLVFDVELLDILEAPTAPPDVSGPPAEAERTESGLSSKVLRPGTGSVHPKPEDTVSVHYTGWTTDGKMFDSSVTRGQPASFPLNRVIPGWTEGVGLMVEGEKRRLWIPEELAYKGRPGAPAGMLVFDVELLKINE